MRWTVVMSKRVGKSVEKLPKKVKDLYWTLVGDIEESGPIRGDWPSYGKLSSTRHHCHIKNGRPTYVVVWEEIDGAIKIVEVVYAGTHEGAPY